MRKTANTFWILMVLANVGSASVLAQDNKLTPKDVTATKPAEKPKVAPGWVVIEEDWWYPLRNEFANSLHQARVLYRAGQEEAAAGEIEKAIAWLKYAQTHADLATQEDLAMARAALEDFASQLKMGKPVRALQLESAFTDASAALAKHHHFLANKALAEDDLKTAGRHLMSAVDHLRDAARSANVEVGSEIVEVYDHYSPFGFWDESVELEKSYLAANLESVDGELQKLTTKLEAK